MLGLQTTTTLIPSSCLRCRLHQAIHSLSLRRRPTRIQRLRLFSSTRQLYENDEQAATTPHEPFSSPRNLHDGQKDHYWRRVRLDSGVDDKTWRRKTQSVASLPSTTLGKPAKIILVRDAEDGEQAEKKRAIPSNGRSTADPASNTPVLTSEEIQESIQQDSEPPKQDEVDASIDSLRPESFIMELAQLRSLAGTLEKSYNKEQLAGYLSRNTSPSQEQSTPAGSSPAYRIGQWQPGKSKSTRRHGAVPHKSTPKELGRNALAKQIILSIWGVKIVEEEQRIGQLEMTLEPWQMTLLFDIKPNGKSFYDEFINSEVLLRTCSVETVRPDSAIRITARRRDAEEIAQRLTTALDSFVSGRFDMSVFGQECSQPGVFEDGTELFSSESLDFIMQSTSSVLQRSEEGFMSIHSRTPSGLGLAFRTLLSLLSMPYHRTTRGAIAKRNPGGERQLVRYKSRGSLAFSEFIDADLHERYRRARFNRVTIPATLKTRSMKGPIEDHLDELALQKKLSEQILAELSDYGEQLKPPTSVHSDLWMAGHPISSPWEAQIAVLLHPPRPPAPPKAQESALEVAGVSTLIPLPTVPGVHHLLEYFEPVGEKQMDGGDFVHQQEYRPDSVHTKRLVAQLLPSPFGGHGLSAPKSLPRLRLEFDRTASNSAGSTELNLVKVVGQLHEDSFKILLPDDATDIDFRRTANIHANAHMLKEDLTFARFRKHLGSTNDTKSEDLTSLSETMIWLPAGLLKTTDEALMDVLEKSEDRPADVPVEYCWQGLEEVESIELQPRRMDDNDQSLDEQTRTILQRWPRHFVLRIDQIEAGAFGGRRTEMRIVNKRQGETADLDQTAAEDSATLVELALTISNFLTRSCYPQVTAANGKPDEVE